MSRKCLECKSLFRGRSDKKYCSEDCRSSYHNKRNRTSNQTIRRINKILRTNRRILQKLFREENVHIHRDLIKDMGFHFDFVTSTLSLKNGLYFKSCYEYGYVEHTDGYIEISSFDQIGFEIRKLRNVELSSSLLFEKVS